MSDTQSVSYRPIGELHLWADNPRQGDIGALIISMSTFGFGTALSVWRGGVVVAGNHRLQAIRKMRSDGEDPPVNVLVSDDGEWLVPCVSVEHLTKTQAEAFALADNRLPALAYDDDSKLAAVLQRVANESTALLSATAYDGSDLDYLLKRAADTAFLDDFLQSDPDDEDEDDGEAAGDRASDMPGAVTLMLAMLPTERKEAMRVLRDHQNAHGLDSMSAAFLHIIGVTS